MTGYPLPTKCPRCGSENLIPIDFEYDEDQHEDVPYGVRCEYCGCIVSHHPHAHILHPNAWEECGARATIEEEQTP